MTPAKIKELRGRRTQREMADLFAVALRTWQDWESGERHPKGTALRLLKLLKERPEMAEWLRGQASEPPPAN